MFWHHSGISSSSSKTDRPGPGVFSRGRFAVLCVIMLMINLVAISTNEVSAASITADNSINIGLGSGFSSLIPDGNWNGFGNDILNTRFQPLAGAINPYTVSRLKVKWAFAFPGVTTASSQPAIVGNTLYIGGWNAHFYALDATTGHVKWDYDTATYTGALPAGANAARDAPIVVGNKVYFGDVAGNLYALNATTGSFIWATHVITHPFARITGSPVYWNGRIFIGTSSSEEANALSPLYPCCTFRGSLVALNANNGTIAWTYYTEPPSQQTGVNAYGTPQYGPAGGAVWSSPAVDPLTGLLYITTGNDYTTPATERSEAIIAIDSNTGTERWHNQLTPNDTWNLACNPESVGLPPGAGANCHSPELEDDDFDFGSAPNIFYVPTRTGIQTLVGAGQKSGIYHALDARTGKIVWQRQLSQGGVAGAAGIQWGSSWDGQRLYVATNVANPGTLFALDPATGNVLWHTANPADGCTTGGGAADPYDCHLAMPAATTVIPGVVFEGSVDGKLRAFNSATGSILWQYDAVHTYTTTNGVPGQGGSFNGGGVSVTSAGMLYVNSGYQTYPGVGIPGNVLLAFGF